MRKPDVDTVELQRIAMRVLPGSGAAVVERTRSGVSTPVYRIFRNATSLYLRVAEGPDDSLAPEALVHDLLRKRGVQVPEIVYFEEMNDVIGRSVMVTSETTGAPISETHRGTDARGVLAAAGRDLAIVNQLRVDGFGWIRRERPSGDRLAGELPTLNEFAFGDLESQLASVSSVFDLREISLIRRSLETHAHHFEEDTAVLAHGDFDFTHIFHQCGEYTGVIDFGEIRGTDRYYDLGYFALHDGEKIPELLLPALLSGYREVSPFAQSDESRIHLWSMVIGIRALSIAITRPNTDLYRSFLADGIRRAASFLNR